MNVINVTTKEDVEMLRDFHSLTVIGITEESFPAFQKIVSNYATFQKNDLYLVKGKLINEICGFEGNNRYKDDLNILCVRLIDIVVNDIEGLANVIKQKGFVDFSFVLESD
mgnify:CR=1 FL=1